MKYIALKKIKQEAAFLLLAAFMIVGSGIYAQKNKPGIYSGGINMGWYNPSLDYFRNESEFHEADFPGAISINALVDYKLTGDLHALVGFGYWQENVEDDLQGFGNTTLQLTGYPFSLGLTYFIKPAGFSVITPYIGIGGELLPIQYKLAFEEKPDPDPTNGSTATGKAIAGIEAQLSENFAIDLDFNYKLGSYKQDFNKAVPNPDDPQNPDIVVETEEISLNGPQIGITLKYLF